jgi:hypothetical protein
MGTDRTWKEAVATVVIVDDAEHLRIDGIDTIFQFVKVYVSEDDDPLINTIPIGERARNKSTIREEIRFDLQGQHAFLAANVHIGYATQCLRR